MEKKEFRYDDCEEIMTIRNKHVESCGKPPKIDCGKVSFVSYFEGSCGDQWLFVYNRAEDTSKIYCADLSWEKPIIIRGIDFRFKTQPLGNTIMESLNNVVLGTSEKKWIIACVDSITEIRR